MDDNIYSLSARGYIDELPQGYTVLSENYSAQRSLSLEDRIIKLEIGALYRGCTRKWIQIYEEEQQIPRLVNAVHDLVTALSSQQPKESHAPDSFGVAECSKRLGCSAGFVRTLVRSGKLQHHWLGKNLRFRLEDIEQFWASHTATQNKSAPKADQDKGTRKHTDNKVKPAPALPSTKEIRKLWQ
jgi:excisionase family DNA binding protein